MTAASAGRWRAIARWALGLVLLAAGAAHLTTQRKEFLAQVPAWVPVDADAVVLASGVVELALGAALIVLRRRRMEIGLVTAVFFIAIFPGNVAQWRDGIDAFGLDTDTKRFVRLFFQPVLVVWALWATGASSWLLERINGAHRRGRPERSRAD